MCEDPPLSTVLDVSHVLTDVQHDMTYTCVADDVGGLTSTAQGTTTCNNNTNFAWNFRDNCTAGKYCIKCEVNTNVLIELIVFVYPQELLMNICSK